MTETNKDKGLDEAKRIMERLVKMPPAPHDSEKAARSQAVKKAKPAKASSSSSSSKR